MKAQEVLKRYADGRRDFRGENLLGLSFQGKDLSGADFSEADIRGTNFSRANLTGAKFVGAKAGLPMPWVIFSLIICCLLSAFSGFLIVYLSYLISFIFSPYINNMIMGLASLLVIFVFNFFLIYRGLSNIAVAFAFAFAGAGAGAVIFGGAVAFAVAVSGAVAVAGAVTIAVAVAVAVAEAIAGARAVAVVFSVIFAVVFVVALLFAKVFIVIVAILLTSVNSYIGWRAIKGDSRDAWIRTMAVDFAATGGTTFFQANLTDADFTKATLKNTDFRKATLIRTGFKATKKLDLARPGNTYLQTRQMQELLQTGQGENQNFDRQDLQGVNLNGANLVGASFIEANLQEASLPDANLSDAKLVRTLLGQTDLTGSTLTGAYIEGWNITSETILRGVKCDYVFMRLPPDKRPNFIALPPEEARDPNPRRQPANWNDYFKEGDFTDFIAPMKHTLNLYHNKSIDPRLIALAFEQLIENNPDADIELVSIEKKGRNKDKVVIRAETSPQADHTVLNAKYSEDLAYLQSLPPEAIRALLIERESTIRLLSGLIEAKHKPPDAHISISPTISTTHIEGDPMSDKSSSFQFGNVGGDVVGVAGGDISGVAGKDLTGVAGGDISGTVTASIGEVTKSEVPEAPKLADLLKQLQSTIESDTHLSEKDRTKALKQVQTLAEAAQNPKNEDKKDLADTAITMLKGIFTGVPVLAASVTVCQELLPAIASLFEL